MTRPFLQEMEARIAEAGDGDVELGEDIMIFDKIASGMRMADIAEELGCSRPFLYVIRKHKPHRERRMRKWKEARAESAEAKEEEGAEILDEAAANAGITNAQASLANSRAKYRQWQAESRAPDDFGRGQDVNVNFNVGVAHLDALRKRGSVSTLQATVVEELEDNEAVAELESGE